MQLPLLLLPISLLATLSSAQCPHMAARRAGGGTPPAVTPPSHHPPTAASPPAAQPAPQFIQTSFIYRPHSKGDELFASLVIARLKELRGSLRKKAAVTIDNENILCTQQSEEPRCADYSAHPAHFHLLVIEDSKKGAAVYSMEADLNGPDSAKIEAALLDALSRHSSIALSTFATPPAMETVGFVRELTSEELQRMAAVSPAATKRTAAISQPPLSVSPLRLQTLDTALLQLRNTEGLDEVVHEGATVSDEKEMDELLKEFKHVFVLFWSKTDSLSLHAHALYANASRELHDKMKEERAVTATVACHVTPAFCVGLASRDLHTVVAFREAIKVATLEILGDVDFYKQWMEMILAGAVRKLESPEEIKDAKRGIVDGRQVAAATVGIFPSEQDPAFSHYQMAGDALLGQHFLFYSIQPDTVSIISTYRSGEKKKRNVFTEDFDPHSIASFIVTSSLPCVVNITHGLSSSALLRSPRPLLVLLAPSSFDSSTFNSFAAANSNSFISAQIDTDRTDASEAVQKALAISSEPHLVFLDKEKVWNLELDVANTAEEMAEWAKETKNLDPDLVLSPFGVHPLRPLQLEHVSRVFGHQQLELPADPSLLSALPSPMDALSSLRNPSSSGGGCPFMKSPPSRDEL